MPSLSQEPDVVKVVLQNGVGLHTMEADPAIRDPRWQQQQIREFVDIAVEAEELGFDGVSLVEHHALSVTAPAPHLLLAAAAMRTSHIRLASAVTVLPLYSPVRVAEESGTLDLLCDGRFELGIGRGTGEVERVSGGAIPADEIVERWNEGIELLHIALTQPDFSFKGKYTQIDHPFALPTRPLQQPFPVWMGSRSLDSVERAAAKGWSVFRNVGTDEEHRRALDHYVEVGRRHGHALSGANFMIERFVFIGETEAEAKRNQERTTRNFTRFRANLSAEGRFSLPPSAQGVAANGANGANHESGPPPDTVVVGTPERVFEALQHTLEATGARRLMVETFSWDEMRQFASEVLPRLQRLGAPLANTRG